MKKTISHNFSIYLDGLRFFAAFIVFLGHTRHFLLPGLKLGPLGYGREAVAIFFVLSGFVISYVVGGKEKDAHSYAVARISRIFPVAILAILVTLLADQIGLAVNAAHYAHLNAEFSGFYKPTDLVDALSYLTFTNQIWFNHAIFGTDEPFWSLGFEIQYYLLFAIVSFLPLRRAALVTAVWALFVGPKILLYLPLWLLGVLAKKLVLGEAVKGRATGAALVVASGILVLALRKFLGDDATTMYLTYPLRQELYNFVYFTLIGVAVLINLIGVDALVRSLPPLGARTSSAIRWLAGGSFTLYLIHQPLLVLGAAILAPVESHRLSAVIATALVFAATYLLAEIGERRKKIVSRTVDGLLTRLGSQRRTEAKA